MAYCALSSFVLFPNGLGIRYLSASGWRAQTTISPSVDSGQSSFTISDQNRPSLDSVGGAIWFFRFCRRYDQASIPLPTERILRGLKKLTIAIILVPVVRPGISDHQDSAIRGPEQVQIHL